MCPDAPLHLRRCLTERQHEVDVKCWLLTVWKVVRRCIFCPACVTVLVFVHYVCTAESFAPEDWDYCMFSSHLRFVVYWFTLFFPRGFHSPADAQVSQEIYMWVVFWVEKYICSETPDTEPPTNGHPYGCVVYVSPEMIVIFSSPCGLKLMRPTDGSTCSQAMWKHTERNLEF